MYEACRYDGHLHSLQHERTRRRCHGRECSTRVLGALRLPWDPSWLLELVRHLASTRAMTAPPDPSLDALTPHGPIDVPTKACQGRIVPLSGCPRSRERP